MNKKILGQIAVILGLTLLVGIFHNISSPTRIHFIGRETTFDFSQSDSLMLALKKQDSLQHFADSVRNLSISREDSLRVMMEKRVKDSLNLIKQDSIKRVQDSIKTAANKLKDSLKNAQNNNTQNNNDIVKPIDIRLDFAKALFDKHYRFIDARDISDYNAGHIQGAMNLPYHDIDKYKDVLDGLPKDQVYVCYCSAACDVSIDLAYKMAHLGFKKLYIFHGGWDEWKNAGYPAN